MAEPNNFGRGELVTPATIKANQAEVGKSPISGAPTTGNILRSSGTSATPPNYQPANMSNQERAIARLNGAMMNAYKPDANKYNKITTYNASHHGRNFERYHAHNSFKALGFSPFRDNESFYNQNSSLWDDTQRGIVTSAKLLWHSASGAAKNWSNPFSLEPDAEEADEMERLMSIGQSSRGGLGSSVINFGVNMSYGMGVMAEVLAEEAAIAGIVALTGLETGGATAAMGAARTGMNIKRLANAFSLGRAAKSFSNTFRAATKITEARQLWGVAKGLGKTVDNLLPFEQTRSLLTASGKTAAKWDSLSNMAKVTKSFGSFYRDVREINAVTYESKLEGGTAQNETTEGMMSQFRKIHGRDPNDQEAAFIHQEARKAGYLSAQMNAIGIYISNKIVLNKALKGIPGIAQADDVARRTMKGTLIQNTNWAKKGINPWEVASGIKKYGKAAFYKQTFNPKNLAKGGLGYLSANLMEGAQEVYQEAVNEGVVSYYMNAYNNPSRVGAAEFQAKMLHGLKSQMSGRGMETFLSGFLMAGPMTMTQSAFFGAFDLSRRAKLKMQDKAFKADPANAGKTSPFEQQLNAEKEYDNKVVDALNDITRDPKKYFSALEINARTQVDLDRLGEMAAADGDMHAAKSIKDESLTNHIITLLESGHFDIFEDQLKGLKDLDHTELQEAFNEPADAAKSVSQRIDTVLGRAKQIKDTYQKYQEKVNPFSMREDPLSYMAFEQARNIAIRNDVTYQRVGERMTDILNQFNSDMPFTNANAADFTSLFVVGGQTEGGLARVGLISEIELLDQQINGLSDSIPEQKLQKDNLIKKRDDLKSLSGTLQAYASSYKVTQSAAQTAEEHAKNMDTFVETEKTFKKAYADYVKNLAKASGQTVLDSAIDSGFEKLADYWKLHADKQDVANAINIMHNPNMYRVSVERLREAMDKAFAARKESLKEALADYKKKHLVNKFFNDLFEKHNAFVEPEEAEAYVSNSMVPETFYDADTLEEIQPGSAKYRGIMALIDQYDELYFEETGERLIRTDSPENLERIVGYDTATGKATYQEFQPRDAKDKRSIKALADEFGFNNLDTESPADAIEVLKKIARSKHSYVPRAQKKLAQALLGFIKPGTVIRFKNGHRTNSTYDATNGIIVDANYSAEGFVNANIPIEFSILNAVMQQVASESLADPEFNNRITALRETFDENLSDADKTYFGYALTNNQQFVAEAMTNADLQAEMAKIDYEGELTEQTAEAKTMWESFMDSVYELLQKLFGVTRGKSLYQEAMNVITNKLSQPGVAGPSAVPSVLAEEEDEEEIDIEEDDAELDQMLRAKFNEIVNGLPIADRAGMNFESWKQTDSMAVAMRNKYKAEKIKKTTATPGGATVMTEAEQVRRLTSLGYQIAEINNMKKNGQQDDIDNIIRNDIKKKIQIRTTDSSGNVTYIEADYDQPITARPDVVKAIKDAVQKLDDANVGLTADEKNYIQRVQVGVDNETGEPIYEKRAGTPLYERVSTVVKDKFEGTTGEATDRGNIIDSMLRDFLKGDILDIRQFRNAYTKYQSKYSAAVFSEDMINDLFDKFRSVQILLKSNGLTVISNLPGLYGKIGNRYTAGAIDLIAYDAAGKVYIIDLKTSTQDRRAQYKLETDLENEFGNRYSEIKEAIKGGSERKKSLSETINSTRISDADKARLRKVAEANPTEDAVYFFKDQDARQQNAYKELLRQSTGLVADVLSIFPLLTTKAGRMFTKVEFQKAGKDHSMRVESYDIHEKLGLVNEATYPENPIDRAAPAPTPTPTPKPATTDTRTKVYDELVDNRIAMDWDSVVYDTTAPGNVRATSGNSNIVDYAGRKIVIINVEGRNIPFYLSTGSGGKVDVTSGKWYPIFGISQSGWLNKLSGKEINNYYGSEILKQIAESLDRKIGDIREDDSIPKVGTKGRHIDAINKDLTPTENELATTRETVEKNIKDTVDFLNGTKLATGETTATPADIEAKRADIAERKKKSLGRLPSGVPGISFNYLTDSGYIGTYYSPDGTLVPIEKNTEKEVIQKINELYAAELDALEAIETTEEQPTEQTELTEKEDIEETIEIANNTINNIKEKIRTLQEFRNGTDSNAAIVKAEKDLAVYYAELKKIEAELADLKKELAALEDAEKQPTEEPTSPQSLFEVVGNDVVYTVDGSVAEEYDSPEAAQAAVKEWRALAEKNITKALIESDRKKALRENKDTLNNQYVIGSPETVEERINKIYDQKLRDAGITPPTRTKGKVKVKVFRTSNTFSSRVGYAQRGAGIYYGLDKPFVELFGEPGQVSEVEVEYDPARTLDATTPEGQAEFIRIKKSVHDNKTFTSISEMNEVLRRAMLASGYDSLIGNITERKPEDGRELVLYNIIEANQGTDQTDKEEMEEEFEEPTPKKQEEPAREKTVYEKAFENSPFQYRPTSSTFGYWDQTEGRIIFFSKKSGEQLLNPNRIRKAALKTFDPNNKKTHPNFKFWWNELLSDRQRYNILDALQDDLWMTAGYADDMYSDEYRIMLRLKNMKFKPTKFNKGEFTDVSDKVWFSDDGVGLDLFVLEDLMGDVNNGFPDDTDQQDLQNEVIDIIKKYPNGITKYDLNQVLRRDSLQAQLEDLVDKFTINYGVDLNSLAALMDMYRGKIKSVKSIQEINEQEDRENEGPSSNQTTDGQQGDNTQLSTQGQENPNQAEIDRLTQEYESTVAKRKKYYNDLANKVGKDRYKSNVRTAEADELARLKEAYEQALEALGVPRSPDSKIENVSRMRIDDALLTLRDSVAKADRIDLQTIEASAKALRELGIMDVVLKQQNLTAEEANQLISDARARLKGTLAYVELRKRAMENKSPENKIVYYTTDKGTQAGVIMGYTDNEIYVAPYDGKETLTDLQDKSKWVTFTKSEIPYKLFDVKTTPPVTATPDIAQQSDVLMNEAEKAEAAEAEKLKKKLEDDKFKNQSLDDAEDDLFNGLDNCDAPF